MFSFCNSMTNTRISVKDREIKKGISSCHNFYSFILSLKTNYIFFNLKKNMLNFCKLGVQVRKEREKARLRAEGEKNVYFCEYFF